MTWIAKPQMATYAAETGVAVGSDAQKTSGAYTKCGRKSAVVKYAASRNAAAHARSAHKIAPQCTPRVM